MRSIVATVGAIFILFVISIGTYNFAIDYETANADDIGTNIFSISADAIQFSAFTVAVLGICYQIVSNRLNYRLKQRFLLVILYNKLERLNSNHKIKTLAGIEINSYCQELKNYLAGNGLKVQLYLIPLIDIGKFEKEIELTAFGLDGKELLISLSYIDEKIETINNLSRLLVSHRLSGGKLSVEFIEGTKKSLILLLEDLIREVDESKCWIKVALERSGYHTSDAGMIAQPF